MSAEILYIPAKSEDMPRFLARTNDNGAPVNALIIRALLHYFAYLRRNPGDPPDGDLHGFNFWLKELAQHHDAGEISSAFKSSIEYRLIQERRP